MAEKWNNRALFRLLWPVVLEQILSVTMGAADTVMVSSVGEFAVSGVNIVDNINQFLVIAFIAFSTGGVVVVSQYIGNQDFKSAGIASKQLVYIVTLVSLVITVIALLFRAPVIRVLFGRLDDDVMKAAMTYFLITALSYPFLALNNACAALYRAAGNSQIPMWMALLANILKIAGNVFFLYTLNMGVAGVALSTLIMRIIAAAAIFLMLVKERRLPVSLKGILNVKIIPSMARRVLAIGVPTGMENSMFQFGRLLTQRIFPVFGTSVIAANAVSGVINSFAFMTGNAYCIALLTVVGQCIGAGDYEGAKKYTAKIVKITWISVSVFSILIFIFRGSLISFFSLGPDAQAAAKVFLSIHCFSMILAWTLSFTIPSSLRAAGDAKYIMIIGTASMWIVRVGGAYFFTFFLGLGPAGVWIAMGCDFLTRGICFSLRWKKDRWQKIKVIES